MKTITQTLQDISIISLQTILKYTTLFQNWWYNTHIYNPSIHQEPFYCPTPKGEKGGCTAGLAASWLPWPEFGHKPERFTDCHTCVYVCVSVADYFHPPANLDIISGPFMRKKKAPVSFATARAIRVFPVPGGPYNNIPVEKDNMQLLIKKKKNY